MVEVIKYSPEHKKGWNAFVAGSKNATFLFYRDYMEYHADRFTDHSLLFYCEGKIVALLPANEKGAEINSHDGLTYGGIITGACMKVEVMLQVFETLILYCRQQGFESINYKTIPHIYHQAPAEEDLYALFKYNATLYRRDVLSVVEQASSIKYSRTRRWEVKKVNKAGWRTGLSQDFNAFMQMEVQLLKEKYNVAPVHTEQEIEKLAKLFPDNIKLYTAEKEGKLGAGVIVYETATVAHCQYIGSSGIGRRNGAISALLHYLINQVYASNRYFDLGASMDEQHTSGLNSTLIANKESYGARTIVHDFYSLVL